MDKDRVAESVFGQLLRRHRLAAGLSQDELAEQARMSTNGISALERGNRRYPYRDTVVLLSKALTLSPAAAAELEAAARRPRQPKLHDRPTLSATSANVSPRSTAVATSNLPTQLTSFIGRETEVSEIAVLLDSHRLVTIVGSGGIGKTRTSLQVAAKLRDSWADGVWLVELAPLTSGDYVPSTVAKAMGFMPAAEGDPVEELASALSEKHGLFVFDNCEHLVEPIARIVSTILHRCPRVTVLASSRQSLGIVGETAYRLPSLELPTNVDDDDVRADDAMKYAAIALFVDRARSVDKAFHLSERNAANVANVCRRLDGIPLAIELAAARVKMLSPRELRERLEQRFQLLTGGSRDVLPRQQTLRALIDWSHDLLEEPERRLFRRLGIFVRGFTLEAAIAIGSDDELDEASVFDLVASLVDKSLVLAEPDGDTLRYRLLESNRVYALEKLIDAAERNVLAGRHLRYLRRHFSRLWAAREQSVSDLELLKAFATELEDIRSALDSAIERSDVVEAADLLADIGEFWQAQGLDAEGMMRCETYLVALPSTESRLLARVSSALSYILRCTGQRKRALAMAIQALAYARGDSEPATFGDALDRYTEVATLLYKLDDAERALNEAEAIPHPTANMRIRLLTRRAKLSWYCGDFETAARSFERLIVENHALENNFEELDAALSLAELEVGTGRSQRATIIVRESLTAVRSFPANGMQLDHLNKLAGYLAAVDDLDGAMEATRAALDIKIDRLVHNVPIAVTIEHVALIFALRGDLTRAARLEGYAEAAFMLNGFERGVTEQITYDRLDALLSDKLEPDELTRLRAEGAALGADSAVRAALAL